MNDGQCDRNKTIFYSICRFRTKQNVARHGNYCDAEVVLINSEMLVWWKCWLSQILRNREAYAERLG